MKFFPALISLSLTALLAAGQTPGLNLRVIEQNAAPDGIAVEVTDPAGNRVPGAKVVFRLPEPSTFADGSSTTAVAATDASGRAEVDGIIWGTASSTASVRITASKGTAHAGLLFEKKLPETQAPAPVNQRVSADQARAVPANEPELNEPAEAVPVKSAQNVRRESPPPAPGIIVVNNGSPNDNVPIRPLVAEAAGGSLSPRLSIVSNGKASSDHHIRNRILIGLAVAAGAGAAIALTRGGGSTSSSGISIGPPSVSVGH